MKSLLYGTINHPFIVCWRSENRRLSKDINTNSVFDSFAKQKSLKWKTTHLRWARGTNVYFNPRHKDKQEYYANKVILSQSDFGFEVNHLESEPGKCFCLFKPSCYANCHCCSLSVCHLKHNPIIAHTLCYSSAVQSDMLNLSRRGKHQIVFYDNMSFIHLSHLQRFISLSLSLSAKIKPNPWYANSEFHYMETDSGSGPRH